MEPIKVIVAEDEFFTREGICKLFEDESDIQVIARADQGEKAVDLVMEHNPDVLLLDIRMPPGIDGVEVIKRLRALGSEIFIIALTQEKRLVKLVEKVGGNGFVPKDKYQMLVYTVRCVARTGSNIFINPEISEKFKEAFERVEDANLTPSEQEVWRLIAYKNEEIARKLNKTTGRIRNLVAEIYFKLDIPPHGEVPQRIVAMELARAYGVLEEPSALSL